MFLSIEPYDTIIRAVLLSILAIVWIILVVRIIGLRSFSKMTPFDFVVTVATGSLLAGASQASNWEAFLQPCVAISSLLGIQYSAARLRKVSAIFKSTVENQPVLLMRNGEILHDALKATRVAEEDVVAKLREANVLDFAQVRAVILETTGDISVLHGEQLQTQLLLGVRKFD
ncbi:DUF421 domain-containing protein [Ahrensia sp. 13_GOM-1096m]|uniref:DUF421 domain-containing protein n=1 Tax=Ahrensia sp. 13_GOM-1096m TaxID=1380380 RepID=UPI00047ACA18|nr:YetF domain-containing protein [Ahrensia sp. 13_GOM-1096m]